MPLRVDGAELRCRVVGEGGNLGFTQAGRIEYAIRGGPGGSGGRINTDAIDNVAGVNTSDHEVNIKILLSAAIADGLMTRDERNALLVEMTDAVADRVLYASYTQTQAMSLALAQAPEMLDVHARLIAQLEQDAGLDRELEALPSERAIAERKATDLGLGRPRAGDPDRVLQDPPVRGAARLRPARRPLPGCATSSATSPIRCPSATRPRCSAHRLRREIIATVVASQLVDRAGTTFAFRLAEETGATTSQLARAFAVAREVFEMRSFWAAVEELDNKIDAQTQLEMLIEGRRLVERATRWLVRANAETIDIEATTERFLAGDADARRRAARRARGRRRRDLRAPPGRAQRGGGARRPGAPRGQHAGGAVRVRHRRGRGCDRPSAARGDGDLLRARLTPRPRLAARPDPRAAARRSLAGARARGAARRSVPAAPLADPRRAACPAAPDVDSEGSIEAWRAANAAAIERALDVLAEVKASGTYDTTTLPVVLRELKSLVRD